MVNNSLDVEEFGIYNGELYVGGIFTNAGGVPTTGIARFSTPTSVNEEPEENSVQIFPNVAANEFTIYDVPGTISKIEMYNALGRKVFEKHLTSDFGHQTISVADFPAGIYFIRVSSSKEQIIHKVIIQR
jgi:hypothetical protein